jgi:hypothetical protein
LQVVVEETVLPLEVQVVLAVAVMEEILMVVQVLLGQQTLEEVVEVIMQVVQELLL